MHAIFYLLLSLFAIGIFLQLDFVFYLGYLIAGVYLLSHAWTWRSLRALGFHRSFHSRAFLNERVRVELEIENRSLLPMPWLRFEELIPLEIDATPIRTVLSVAPKGRMHFSYDIVGDKRGVYRLGPARFQAGDLFGFSNPRPIEAPAQQITVYPLILPVSELGLPSRSLFGTIKGREHIFEDPTRAVGVRDYQPGDSLRHMNWKVSARQRKLQTRTFQPTLSLDSMIVLNLNEGEYDRYRGLDAIERAIVVAASLANHLIQRRQAVGLVTNGCDSLREGKAPIQIPPRPGRAHLMRLLESLARVKKSDELPFSSLLHQRLVQLPWGITLIVVTNAVAAPILHELHALHRCGYAIVLITVEPQAGFPRLRRQAGALGISAYQVSRLPRAQTPLPLAERGRLR